MGSRTMSVMLPKAAMTPMATRTMYLTLRRRGGSRFAARPADLKRSHPSSVPSGQIQPHQKRPRTTAPTTVASARARSGIQVRAASIVPNAASGSKRKKMSASGSASCRCSPANNR